MSQKTMSILQESLPVFNMLADDNRQQLLVMLFDDGPQTVTELTSKIALSQPTVSHHLKLLSDAGLISMTKKGRERVYAVSPLPAIALLETLINSLKTDFAERHFE